LPFSLKILTQGFSCKRCQGRRGEITTRRDGLSLTCESSCFEFEAGKGLGALNGSAEARLGRSLSSNIGRRRGRAHVEKVMVCCLLPELEKGGQGTRCLYLTRRYPDNATRNDASCDLVRPSIFLRLQAEVPTNRLKASSQLTFNAGRATSSSSTRLVSNTGVDCDLDQVSIRGGSCATSGYPESRKFLCLLEGKKTPLRHVPSTSETWGVRALEASGLNVERYTSPSGLSVQECDVWLISLSIPRTFTTAYQVLFRTVIRVNFASMSVKYILGNF